MDEPLCYNECQSQLTITFGFAKEQAILSNTPFASAKHQNVILQLAKNGLYMRIIAYLSEIETVKKNSKENLKIMVLNIKLVQQKRLEKFLAKQVSSKQYEC